MDGWKGPAAINMTGTLQVLDSTFTNPVMPGAVAVSHLTPDDLDGVWKAIKQVQNWPILLSNNSIDKGHVIRPASEATFDTNNLSYTLPAGKCAATGIDASTIFFKKTWPTPGKVFEISQFLSTGVGENVDVTAAVQATIDAAANAGNGAVAYFPSGSYPTTSSIKVSGKGTSVSVSR